jgi:hypothetical protein
MKQEIDFSHGKRGAPVALTGKTRITIYLDDAIIERFKAESEKTGKGYQTLINDALAHYSKGAEQPVTATEVRKIVREELKPAQWQVWKGAKKRSNIGSWTYQCQLKGRYVAGQLVVETTGCDVIRRRLGTAGD